MIRYVLHPGEGDPDGSGRVRKISARELADLYEVPLNECITFSKFEEQVFDQANLDQIIHLKVDNTGEYDIAKAEQESQKTA